MVFYFKAIIPDEIVDIERQIYMGRDKIENDPLIHHSHPKNIWFHVDNVSLAHVYLQLTAEEIKLWKLFQLFDVDERVLEQMAQLVKANSIKGNKLNNVTIIYTPVENLHTDGLMDTGTVTFKNPKLVKRVKVAKKDNAIINKLNKTKTEGLTEDFIAAQQELAKQIDRERKEQERLDKELELQYAEAKRTKNDPYADLYSQEAVNANLNEFRNENWVDDEFW